MATNAPGDPGALPGAPESLPTAETSHFPFFAVPGAPGTQGHSPDANPFGIPPSLPLTAFASSRLVLDLFEDRDKDFAACRAVLTATMMAVDSALAPFLSRLATPTTKPGPPKQSPALAPANQGPVTTAQPARAPPAQVPAPQAQPVTWANVAVAPTATANTPAAPARHGANQGKAANKPQQKNGPPKPNTAGPLQPAQNDNSGWSRVQRKKGAKGSKPKGNKTARNPSPRAMLRLEPSSPWRDMDQATLRISLCTALGATLAAFPAALPTPTGWSVICKDADHLAKLLGAGDKVKQFGARVEAFSTWASYVVHDVPVFAAPAGRTYTDLLSEEATAQTGQAPTRVVQSQHNDTTWIIILPSFPTLFAWFSPPKFGIVM
ncbi:hypothetical protein F4861DRAFT_544514, partial [Xylaria intraflava]